MRTDTPPGDPRQGVDQILADGAAQRLADGTLNQEQYEAVVAAIAERRRAQRGRHVPSAGCTGAAQGEATLTGAGNWTPPEEPPGPKDTVRPFAPAPEVITRRLAEAEPYTLSRDCVFCGAYPSERHDDCVWQLARDWADAQ